MANELEPIVVLVGEVRQVQKKADFTDRTTGEVRLGKGRTADVLTYGGFVKLSIGEAFDEVPFSVGDVLVCKIRLLDWRVPTRTEGGQDRTGTAKLFDGFLTDEEFNALKPVARTAVKS